MGANGCRPGKKGLPARGKPVNAGSGEIEHQKLPQEPRWTARPERQREITLGESRDARVGCRDEIYRIIRDGHQQEYGQSEWHAEPQNTITRVPPAALARKTGPDKHARHEEHQRHQIDVLGRAEEVKPEPSLAIDDWKGSPLVGRTVERLRRGRQEIEIGYAGVKCEHDEDRSRSQIAERQAGS